jgi:fatty acid desaturase
MKLIKACVEALAILAAVVAIVGGILGFVIFAAAASQVVGVWLFPVTILGAYLIFVAALYNFHRKGVNKSEVSNVARDNTKPSGSSSVVKLDDLTVATAIREAKQRERTRYDNE